MIIQPLYWLFLLVSLNIILCASVFLDQDSYDRDRGVLSPPGILLPGLSLSSQNVYLNHMIPDSKDFRPCISCPDAEHTGYVWGGGK